MKKSDLIFASLLVPLDFLMLILGAISAYNLRFAEFTAEIRPVIFSLPFSSYIYIVFYIAIFWLLIFAAAGLYNIKGFDKISNEIYRVVFGCSTGLVAVIIFMFFRRELFSSRFIILAAWFFSIIYVLTARIFIRKLQRHLYRLGIGVNRVAIIGDTETSEKLIGAFSANRAIGYEIVKKIKSLDAGAYWELENLVKFRNLDEVVQADPNLSKEETLKIMDFCEEHHLVFKYAADLLGTKILKTEVNMIAGIPIVELKITPLDGWGRIAKRIADVIFSIFFIILFSPIYLIAALLIKLESRGPVIYKNERVSKEGIFNLFKFRSMQLNYCVGPNYQNNSEALEFEQELIEKQNTKTGPVYKIGNDPRLTKVGRFIRRFSIDELPQFFNVFLGTMSIVGPRPHQPREVALYQKNHKKVLAIKPGLTGLAQISGRSDLNFEEEVKIDTYYIENWSPWLDIIIMLKTPLAILKKRKAE
jgi:exopolysaccharide biosynthesis polyprenyl glycosylphosphotransferase